MHVSACVCVRGRTRGASAHASRACVCDERARVRGAHASAQRKGFATVGVVYAVRCLWCPRRDFGRLPAVLARRGRGLRGWRGSATIGGRRRPLGRGEARFAKHPGCGTALRFTRYIFLLFGGRQLAFSPTFARLSIPAFPMVDGGASEVRTFY